MLATDMPGVVDTNISAAHHYLTGSLDMCQVTAVQRLARFDLIVSSGGVTQSSCGPHTLIRLSTYGTLVHMVVRDDVADRYIQRFLLDSFFIELFRMNLQDSGDIQPGEKGHYVVWMRKLGPHSCFHEGYTFEMCCKAEPFWNCFDRVYTKELCCGGEIA
eukprot:TRINITY_DN17550_c0_g1_i1.p1 TRINITY_DN17550_c0_g1~~TRINITY_DN17550_c0_g1_i1.p1  ORF type:complete len:160 (+),score=10.92 TRINITY_DN17550_c0_g1_i1:156-635(+)